MQSMVDITQNPYFWSVLAIASLLLFAFKIDKAAIGLGFTVIDATQAQDKRQFSPLNIVKFALALAFALALVYFLKAVHFYFTLAALIAFFIYFWTLTYKRRIKRLKDAGLPSPQVVILCSLTTLFSLCALIATAMFSWASRGAP
jgi:Flp pilus assembly protein TadB